MIEYVFQLSLLDYKSIAWFTIADFKKTSIGHSIQVFEKFVKELEKSWSGKLIEESGQYRYSIHISLCVYTLFNNKPGQYLAYCTLSDIKMWPAKHNVPFIRSPENFRGPIAIYFCPSLCVNNLHI